MEVEDIENTIKRIQAHKGVQGVVIATRDGFPIRTTMDNTSTVLYIADIFLIEERARSMIRDIDPTNSLRFMRIRSKKYELMVSAEEEYVVLVIQNPHEN